MSFKRKFMGWLCKAPLMLLVIGSLIASLYLAYTKQMSITYSTSILLGVIIALFILGDYLLMEEEHDESV